MIQFNTLHNTTPHITIHSSHPTQPNHIITIHCAHATQAEMYKQMGLWPLALGIYLDCADLTVTLLGFHDDMSLHAWRAVTEVR